MSRRADDGTADPNPTLRAVDQVLQELTRCVAKHPAFHSSHEGYAVLLEEVDELWDDVKMRLKDYDYPAMRLEAVQVAAQALRFILDVCEPNGALEPKPRD